MDLLERLDNWRGQHKSHACSICHDDGYGASEWEVELIGSGKRIFVVPGSNSDRDERNAHAMRTDVARMVEDVAIAGYRCYIVDFTPHPYTYVIGKDGHEATLEDLLTVALEYMND
jgi:hypothetical protein